MIDTWEWIQIHDGDLVWNLPTSSLCHYIFTMFHDTCLHASDYAVHSFSIHVLSHWLTSSIALDTHNCLHSPISFICLCPQPHLEPEKDKGGRTHNIGSCRYNSLIQISTTRCHGKPCHRCPFFPHMWSFSLMRNEYPSLVFPVHTGWMKFCSILSTHTHRK